MRARPNPRDRRRDHASRLAGTVISTV
jgi:hypothetical protein